MEKGKLIVIEGNDCSGKETQSNLLVKRLKAMGIKAVNLSFPWYDTPTGKIVGGPILGRKENGECWFPEGPVHLAWTGAFLLEELCLILFNSTRAKSSAANLLAQ